MRNAVQIKLHMHQRVDLASNEFSSCSIKSPSRLQSKNCAMNLCDVNGPNDDFHALYGKNKSMHIFASFCCLVGLPCFVSQT